MWADKAGRLLELQVTAHRFVVDRGKPPTGPLWNDAEWRRLPRGLRLGGTVSKITPKGAWRHASRVRRAYRNTGSGSPKTEG